METTTTTRYYTATVNGSAIITVIARSMADAISQITDQLAGRPGRGGYYRAWQEAGRIVTAADRC